MSWRGAEDQGGPGAREGQGAASGPRGSGGRAGAAKTVVVIDRELPAGLAVNAACIAASMLTSAHPELMGPPVAARDGELPGVVLVPLPVLVAQSDQVTSLWARARDRDGVETYPFTSLAQRCRTYEEYTAAMAAAAVDELRLASLGLCGQRKVVDALTGGLPLYRGAGGLTACPPHPHHRPAPVPLPWRGVTACLCGPRVSRCGGGLTALTTCGGGPREPAGACGQAGAAGPGWSRPAGPSRWRGCLPRCETVLDPWPP